MQKIKQKIWMSNCFRKLSNGFMQKSKIIRFDKNLIRKIEISKIDIEKARQKNLTPEQRIEMIVLAKKKGFTEQKIKLVENLIK